MPAITLKQAIEIIFLTVSVFTLPLSPAIGQHISDSKKPNIIFIMSDDHGYQAISAYNSRLKTIAPTPNIDRIARNGIRFDRCLVTNSLCGPSRAVLLTGKYSHLNGFIDNSGKAFDGSQQTFPKLLQQAGYQTAIVGKWHLVSSPTGFNHWEILNDQGQYYNPEFINADGMHTEQGYVTDLITTKAIDWLEQERKTGQPFMLMVHHKAPHREWEPDLKYLTSFTNANFPEPSTLFDDYSGRGRAAKEQKMTIANDMRVDADLKMWEDTNGPDYARTRGRLSKEQGEAWDHYYDSVKKVFKSQNLTGKALVKWKYQHYLHDYLSCIKSVDESVGKILDYLKQTGLDKNTIVIYTSDQGFYLGEHGWFDKRFMYEESYRTPLLVQWPGKIKAGSVNSDIVSNLDFAETILDIAGVNTPHDMQGISLVPLLKGHTPANWRTEHYYHYYEYPVPHAVKKHYGISTKRYVLIHFYDDIDEWELYDLQKDPQELHNVYNDAAYTQIRDHLKTRLVAIRKYYRDDTK